MTTVLYVKDDGLYSDSKFVSTFGGSLPVITYKPKIKLSECKTFIWGYTGNIVTNDIESIEGGIREWLKINGKRNHPYGIGSIRVKKNKDSSENTAPLFLGSAFIATKKKKYYYSPEGGSGTMLPAIDLETDGREYYGVGTGGMPAMAIMRLTGDPMLAMEKTLEYDASSGGPIHYISFNELADCEEY